jgi:hypothetical protein
MLVKQHKVHRPLQHVSAVIIYLSASLFLLGLPIHFDWWNKIAGTDSTDPMVFLWWFARWSRVLGAHSSFLYTHLIWAPIGQNIAWTACIPGLAIPLSGITLAGGPILSFNVAVITAPTLAATGLYLTCREIDLPWGAALFGGWLFGFSSYEFAQLLGEINLAVVWALPFLLWLFLLRLHNRIGRKTFTLASAALLAFQFCVSSEIFATAVVFSAIAMTLALLSPALLEDAPGLKRTILEGGAALPLSLVILAPYVYSMLGPGSEHLQQAIGISPSDVMADPLNFVIPTDVLWLGTRIFGPIGSELAAGMSDKDAYLGLPLVIILALYAREFGHAPKARYLLVVLVTFAVLSLGPRLRILGQITPVIEPWMIFMHLPLIGKALPARFALYVAMAASVIAATWLARSSLALWKKRLAVSLTVLFLLPNVDSLPMHGSLPHPRFFFSEEYRTYIRPKERVIVLPYGPAMWFQAETHFYFRMVGGYVGGAEPQPFSSIAVDNVLNGGPLAAGYRQAFRQFLKRYKVGAIITYGPQSKDIRTLLASLPVRGAVVGGVTVFALTPSAGPERYRRKR